MRQLLKQQIPFLFLFSLFFLFGGIFLFFIEKGDVILFFSERRSVAGDLFFKFASLLGEYIPYLAGIAIFIYLKKYLYAAAMPALAILVTIVSYLSKSYFSHYRPATFFKEMDLLDQVVFVEGIFLNKGASSFPSGHTMSAFAIYFFLALALPKLKYLSGSLFAVAFLVAISRIYLVQHFFEDVYLGSIMGVLIGLIVFMLVQLVEEKRRRVNV